MVCESASVTPQWVRLPLANKGEINMNKTKKISRIVALVTVTKLVEIPAEVECEDGNVTEQEQIEISKAVRDKFDKTKSRISTKIDKLEVFYN